ncbi:MAG: MBL fold metallo-hydrolase [Oceanidesulfovibrio sp.]
MDIQLIPLVDNTSSALGLPGEHGLSLAVRLNDGSLWLWDTGASDLAARNARALKVDISKARGLALSHGHYDHTNGIEAFLEAGFSGPVHAHPESVAPCWSIRPDRPVRFIGWNNPEAVRPMLRPVRGVRVLAADAQGNPLLTMVTDIARLPGNAQHVGGFFCDEQGAAPHHVPDDACLVLHTPQGRVLVLGCCHSGLANTLAAADTATAHEADTGFACVLGGLHLMDVCEEDDARLRQTLDALARHHV